MTNSQEYSHLLALLINLVESQAGKVFDQEDIWMNSAQILSVKLFRHLCSMQSLARPLILQTQDNPKIAFIDHASVKVITRTALETYLVFFYIFGSQDSSTCKFRHWTWELGGLIDRQKTHVISQQGQELLAQEKIQIENLRERISTSPLINEYTEKQQKRLLNGEWRLDKSWKDLGLDAGFHTKYFSNIYNYLCGYSHSSYISALQISGANSTDEQLKLAECMLDIGAVLMAHFCFSYSNAFRDAQKILLANPTSARIAEKWHFSEPEMSSIYEGDLETHHKP